MTVNYHESVQVRRGQVTRRGFMHQVSAAGMAAGALGLHDWMSLHADELRKQQRSVILLWMAGGPSQLETFDPKPGYEGMGETETISTAVSGIQLAQGWDKTAAMMNDIALIRSMTNKEGNHRRATYQMHTGYVPSGSVKHPSLSALLAKETADRSFDLPSVVSVGNTVGAGFLGVDYEPFRVDQPGEIPRNVDSVVADSRYNRRLGVLKQLEGEFARAGGRTAVNDHQRIYKKASQMVMSPRVKAFDISSEPDEIKAAYGDNDFGKSCLLARRLVETGVTFVEVVLRGWDTHTDVFERTGNLISQVDPAYAALIGDLKQRGQLDKTLVICMGEFGRTPRINPRGGRDHYPRVFSLAMAGGGVQGGQVIGSSNEQAAAVKENPISVQDLFCTVCSSMKVDPRIENMSPLGRPMKIVDGGKVVDGLLG